MGSSISKTNENKGVDAKSSGEVKPPLKYNKSVSSNSNVICMAEGTQELLDKFIQSISVLPTTSFFTFIFKSENTLTISSNSYRILYDTFNDFKYTFISSNEVTSLGDGKYRVPRENANLLPIDFSIGTDKTGVEFFISESALEIKNDLCKNDQFPLVDIPGKCVSIPIASAVNVNNKSGLFPYFVYLDVTNLKVAIGHFNTIKLKNHVCSVYKINVGEVGDYFKKYTKFYLDSTQLQSTFTSTYLVVDGTISGNVVTFKGSKFVLANEKTGDFYLEGSTIKPVLETKGTRLTNYILNSGDSVCEIFTNLPALKWSTTFDFLYATISIDNIKLIAIILNSNFSTINVKMVLKLPTVTDALKTLIQNKGFSITETTGGIFMHNITGLTNSNIVTINPAISSATFSLNSTTKLADYVITNGSIHSLIKENLNKNADLIVSSLIKLDHFTEKFSTVAFNDFNLKNLLVCYSEISNSSTIMAFWNSLKYKKVENMVMFTKQPVDLNNSLFSKSVENFSVVSNKDALLTDANVVRIGNDLIFKVKINNNEYIFTVDPTTSMENIFILKSETSLNEDDLKLYTNVRGGRFGLINDPLNISVPVIQGVPQGISYFSFASTRIESARINESATLQEERIVYVNVHDNFNINSIITTSKNTIRDNADLKMAVIVPIGTGVDEGAIIDQNTSIVTLGGEKFVFIYPTGTFFTDTIKFTNLKVKFVNSKNDFTPLEIEDLVTIQQVTLSDLSNLNVELNSRIKYLNTTIFSSISGLEIYYIKNYQPPPITNLQVFSTIPTIINIESNINEIEGILKNNVGSLLHYDFLMAFRMVDWFNIYNLQEKILNFMTSLGFGVLKNYKIGNWLIYSKEPISKIDERIIYKEIIVNYGQRQITNAINVSDLKFTQNGSEIIDGYRKLNAPLPYTSQFSFYQINEIKSIFEFEGGITYPQTQPTVLVLNKSKQEEIGIILNLMSNYTSPILLIVKSDTELEDLDVFQGNISGNPIKYLYYRFQHPKWSIEIEDRDFGKIIKLRTGSIIYQLGIYSKIGGRSTAPTTISYIHFNDIPIGSGLDAFVIKKEIGFWNFIAATEKASNFFPSKDLLKIKGIVNGTLPSLAHYSLENNITLSGFITSTHLSREKSLVYIVKFPTNVADLLPFYSNQFGSPSLTFEFGLVGLEPDAKVIIIGPENKAANQTITEIPPYEVRGGGSSDSSAHLPLNIQNTSSLYHLSTNVWLNKTPEVVTSDYVKFGAGDSFVIFKGNAVTLQENFRKISFNKNVSWIHTSYVTHTLLQTQFQRNYMGVNLTFYGLK